MQKKVSHNFERTRAFVRTMMPQHTLPCVGGAYRLCHSYSTSVAHNTSVREQSVNQSAKEPGGGQPPYGQKGAQRAGLYVGFLCTLGNA